MSTVKSIILNRYSYDSQLVSKTNAYWGYARGWDIGLHFQFDDGNETHTAAGGYGDGIMTSGSMRVDGDLIVSAGHADGFAIRRIQDDGTLDYIYGVLQPDGSYASYHSAAVDTARHVAYIGNYVYDRITKIDYSQCFGGDDSVTIVGNLTEAANDLPADEVGYTYTNGLELVGDYLYIMPDDKSSNQAMRWNTQTETDESLPMVNNTTNGRYGRVFYDEVNNRIYGIYRDSIGMYCVVNPENAADHPTDPAVAYYINLSGIGANSSYSSGIWVDPADPTGNTVLIRSSYGRMGRFDITNCVNGTDSLPTLLYRHPELYGVYSRISPYGGAYNEMVNNPMHPTMPMVAAGGALNPWLGWVDTENCVQAAMPHYDTTYWEGIVQHRLPAYSFNLLMFDYSPVPKIITSAGPSPTTYMFMSGYADDGYKYRTWTTDKCQLHHSGELVWGTFSLDSGQDVVAFKLQDMAFRTFVPTGTTFTVECSNDNGVTWELYDRESEDVHVFSSTGSQVRMKITMTGDGTRCSHVTGTSTPIITIYGEGSLYDASGVTDISNYKIKAL